jgi:uncharacterized protein (TIGR02266 family)
MARTSVEGVVDLSTADAETAEDRRRFERSAMVVRVEYSSVDEFFSEFTRDINEGGVFIETDEPQELGTTVQLQFHLPGSDEPIRTAGVVVRVDDGGDGRLSGMALEFDELSSSQRDRINGVIRSMKSSGP